MNYNLIFKNVENVKGEKKDVIDANETLKKLCEALNNMGSVKAGTVNPAQIAGIIADSQKKTQEIANLKTQISKVNNDNRKLSNNLVKLLKRVEKLEKDDSTSASIPEF
jgi:predicted  nucleic acid-binding Zn-ribbon protein